MPARKKRKTRTVNKSAKTGKFVTKGALKRSPSTTFKQKVKTTKRKKRRATKKKKR